MAQHVEDIVDDCELSGLSHTVGVHVHGYERSRRRKEALASRRAFNLSLAAGDLYVFNSNRLHAVPAVIGPRDRVALGAFIGCVCPVPPSALLPLRTHVLPHRLTTRVTTICSAASHPFVQIRHLRF